MLREIYPITVVESDKGSSSILSPTGMAGDGYLKCTPPAGVTVLTTVLCVNMIKFKCSV